MNRLQKLCRDALCVPIRLYKRYISPGLGRNCRFTPTCSEYAIEAIQTHGCVKGLVLAAWRIARCNPLGPLGLRPRARTRPLGEPKAGAAPAPCPEKMILLLVTARQL